MNASIAALSMYDWPETRSSVDAQWRLARDRLRQAGIDAPPALIRRNGDMPAVAGGIRDQSGNIIAPDPATLPPDEFDVHTLWRHPGLLLAQTCWGPMEQGLVAHVVVVGQPNYDGIEGGHGELYSSSILMRRKRETADVPSPADGHSTLPLQALRGKRLAYNSADSMSGIVALTRDLEAGGASLAIFSDRIETGSHRGSIRAVAEGRADVCAIDCRSWRLAQLYETRAADVRVVGWTARRKGLPLITSAYTLPETLAKLQVALADF